MSANSRYMTKCHLLSLGIFLLMLAACKGGTTGPSLSEYGARSQATQNARFEQYVVELWNTAPETARQRQDSLLTAAEGDSAQWRQLIDLEDRFLFDPNSPYRNEELYLPVAEHLLTAPYATEEQRSKAGWMLPKLRLNRPGTPAADFEFLTPQGRRTSLYAILNARKPQLTVLFFSNPGCNNCKEVTEAFSHSLYMQSLIENGSLLVVNIYPDEDVQAWLDYLSEYPKEWICGYDADQRLHSDEIYWLRAIPSLYLLDGQKRVILKDATPENILRYCEQR